MGILFRNLEDDVSAPRPVPPAAREPTVGIPQPLVRAAPAEKRPAYTIDDAVALMKSLPLEQNEDVIVRVVRSVWNTMRVSVTDIVEDAGRREKDLTEKVSALTDQIRDLDAQVSQRREQIRTLETELRDVVTTKERLAKTETVAAEAAAEVVEGEIEEEEVVPPMPSSTRARITREEVVADPSAQPTVLMSSKRLTPPPPPRRA